MRKSTFIWALNIFLVLLVAFLLFGWVRSDPESATASKAKAEPEPAANEHITPGPYAEQLEALAADISFDGYDDNWEFSKVLGVSGDNIRVQSGEGTILLYGKPKCDDEQSPAGYYDLLVDPGNLILWDRKGDDMKLCPGEIVVVG